MKQDFLISVVMPVFRARLSDLRQSLGSILNQTYGNFELLIVYEPVPGDGLSDYLEKQADPRIRVIKTPRHAGLPRSLNMGLDEAKGKYIARMDADDISLPDRFEKQLAYMESHQKLAVLGSDISILGQTSRRRRYPGVHPKVRAVRMLFYNAGIAHPTAFMRKRFLDENGIRYNEKISGSEDYYLWIDIILHGGAIHHLNEALLKYRLSDAQATARFSEKIKAWDTAARIQFLEHIGQFDDTDREVLSTWNDTFLSVPAEDVLLFLNQVITQNRRSRIFDDRVLKKELAFRYLVKALILYRHGKDASMLKMRYLVNAGCVGHMGYIVRNMVQILMN